MGQLKEGNLNIDEVVDFVFTSHEENKQIIPEPSRRKIKDTLESCELKLHLIGKDRELQGCCYVKNTTMWFSDEVTKHVVFVYIKPEFRNYRNFKKLIRPILETGFIYMGAYCGKNTSKIGSLFSKIGFKEVERVYVKEG